MWHCTTIVALTHCLVPLYLLYLLSGHSPKRVVYKSWAAIAALERCHNETPDNRRIISKPEPPPPTRQPQYISQAPSFGHDTHYSSLQSWASFSCVHAIKPSHKTKSFAIWQASHAWSWWTNLVVILAGFSKFLPAVFHYCPFFLRLICMFCWHAWDIKLPAVWWPPDRAVWVRALAGDILLCSWARNTLYSRSASFYPGVYMGTSEPSGDNPVCLGFTLRSSWKEVFECKSLKSRDIFEASCNWKLLKFNSDPLPPPLPFPSPSLPL